jgi:glycosyltransferase involved in cell wall biosynthesis
MRIAVNTRLLLPGKLEGIGWFAYETLIRITRAHPEVEFIFIFDRKPAPEFIFDSNVKAVVAHPQARHPVLWYLFFEFGVYRVLQKYKPDLFLSPDGWISLRSKTPALAVIHDLNFEAHPEFLPRYLARYYHHFFPRFAEKAKRIATVSAYTKMDIHTRYGKALDEIDVVYNGASDRYKPISENEKLAVRSCHSFGEAYFLFVGLIHPRKNLLNQLRAFDAFKKQSGSKMKFVVVGARYSLEEGFDAFLESCTYRSDIIFKGRMEQDALTAIYASAFALMYASHFEGFGIPILEAMACEVPVITSNVTAMPEIGGDAALLVNPNDVNDIAAAMLRLHEDAALYQQCVAAGVERRKAFSWDKTADLLWDSVQKALLKH